MLERMKMVLLVKKNAAELEYWCVILMKRAVVKYRHFSANLLTRVVLLLLPFAFSFLSFSCSFIGTQQIRPKPQGKRSGISCFFFFALFDKLLHIINIHVILLDRRHMVLS